MTISDLGAIGELIGSFAVLLTLIYLAIQVRHSRELLERQERLGLGQAYQAKFSSRIELEKLVIELAEVSVRVHKGAKESTTSSVKLRNSRFASFTHSGLTGGITISTRHRLALDLRRALPFRSKQ